MIFLWVLLYGLIHTLLSQLGDVEGWIRGISVLLYAIILMVWTFRRKQPPKERMVIPQDTKDRFLLSALALMPVCNFFVGNQAGLRGPDVVLMLGVAITEEVFFRGYLFTFLRKKNDFFGIMATSGIFAALHLANGFQNADIGFVLVQSFCAFFVSVLYCTVVIRFDHLGPCMVAHFATNLTGSGEIENIRGAVILCICAVICGGYGIWSFFKIGNTQRRQFDATVY